MTFLGGRPNLTVVSMGPFCRVFRSTGLCWWDRRTDLFQHSLLERHSAVNLILSENAGGAETLHDRPATAPSHASHDFRRQPWPDFLPKRKNRCRTERCTTAIWTVAALRRYKEHFKKEAHLHAFSGGISRRRMRRTDTCRRRKDILITPASSAYFKTEIPKIDHRG